MIFRKNKKAPILSTLTMISQTMVGAINQTHPKRKAGEVRLKLNDFPDEINEKIATFLDRKSLVRWASHYFHDLLWSMPNSPLTLLDLRYRELSVSYLAKLAKSLPKTQIHNLGD